ncbi:hypothetical protein JJD41_23300 [Oxynema sp. CENA135]|uniref:hypothetical protein n=1 Tax=Oxynema sp. CENA135 TaxID=984206 RepID=UPI00190A26B4|nr:hypothetical protein [Oxynema sp. CENA135]MBK4732770.1 hypothetical protein [Oxynema sp. CENA135]
MTCKPYEPSTRVDLFKLRRRSCRGADGSSRSVTEGRRFCFADASRSPLKALSTGTASKSVARGAGAIATKPPKG